jgi:cytochrome c553
MVAARDNDMFFRNKSSVVGILMVVTVLIASLASCASPPAPSESVPEAVSGPISEPTPEAVAESVSEPTPESTPEPIEGRPFKGRTLVAETPENIRLRSGPGDPVAGKDKSELCQGCHGERGLSSEPMIPHLAGQFATYIAKNLRNFQTGHRTHQIMSAMAATINDADLDDIAAYFASQPRMQGNGPGPNSEVGRNLFMNGDMERNIVACIFCHGFNGKGLTATNPTFPVIGGQHEGYLRGQLLNWKHGERANSPGGIMNIIAQKLTDTEIESLASYISGL